MAPVSAQFGALLDAALDAVAIVDAGGSIIAVNGRVEPLFGYAPTDLLGQRVEVLMPERFRVAHVSHRDDYRVGPRPRPMGEGRLSLFGLKKDGTEFPAEISLSPLETEEGRVVITAIRDISGRQQAELERCALLKAQEAIRMRDEFLAVASHELKAPLSAVLMQVETIFHLTRKGEVAVPDPLAKRLQGIARGMRRLSALVDHLLDLSRITSGRLAIQRTEVDLSATARNVLQLFDDELAGAGIAVRLHADKPVAGQWDALRIEEIITNLISNAIKYGSGKPIEVVVVGEARPGVAVLSVRDHGIGIAPEHYARIFDRFERIGSERRAAGLGLGLWITKQLVEAHGGTIRVWSEPGAGSLFTVELPRAPGPSASPSQNMT